MSVCHPNNRSKAWWRSEEQRGEIVFAKGSYATGMGYNIKGKTFLYPEELLFLVDRGALDVYFPLENQGDFSYSKETFSALVPITFPTIFSLVMNNGLNINLYQVYSHLKRLGYIVRRTEEIFPTTQKRLVETFPASNTCPVRTGSIYTLANNFSIRSQLNTLPLVLASQYKTYDDIFKMLKVISEAPQIKTKEEYLENGQYRPHFQIWQPSSNFKRTNPGPAFRLVTIVSMNDEPPLAEDFTSLAQLDTPVTVAMVDEGNISFIDPRPGKVTSL